MPVVMCILFHNSRLDRLIDQRVSQSGFIFLSWNRKNPQPSRMKPFSAFYPSVPDKSVFSFSSFLNIDVYFFSTFVTHVSNPSNCLSIFKFDTDSVNFLVPQRHIQFKTGLNRV